VAVTEVEAGNEAVRPVQRQQRRGLPDPAPPLRAGASSISPSCSNSATSAVVVLRGSPIARESCERLIGPSSRIIVTRWARRRV
jgi:hypothetical protein